MESKQDILIFSKQMQNNTVCIVLYSLCLYTISGRVHKKQPEWLPLRRRIRKPYLFFLWLEMFTLNVHSFNNDQQMNLKIPDIVDM